MRRSRESLRGTWIPIDPGKLVGCFRHEPLQSVALPELASAGISGIVGELRRDQHGIDPGFGNLLGQQLTVPYVALKRCAVTMEEHHDDRRLAHVESRWH